MSPKRVRRPRPSPANDAIVMRRAHLRRKFGMTEADWDALYEVQDGVCAICEKPEHVERRGKVMPLSVDHDHSTGRVRGLLCNFCNTALGKFNDDPDLLRKAAVYVSR